MMARTAILFVAHSVNRELLRRYRSIADDLPSGFDAFFALDATRSRVRYRVDRSMARTYNLFLFSRDLLSKLPYERARRDWQGRSLVPGLQDLLPQAFRRLNPGYDFIYFIEYDVLYSGRWRSFFSAFQDSSSAYIATSVTAKVEVPDWEHFATFKTDRPLPDERILRSFMPICRYSTPGLDALEERYSRGWRGHHEVLVPTATLDAGLTVEDFGGDGRYVRPGNRNRFYTSSRLEETLAPGSFVFIPEPSEVPRDRPVLLHPCKTDLGMDGSTLFRLLRHGPLIIRADLAKSLGDRRIAMPCGKSKPQADRARLSATR